MMKIFLALVFVAVVAGCYYQPLVIGEPPPRVVIKEVPGGVAKTGEKEEFFESFSVFPDITRGYIENRAFPFLPKVWLIKGNQKIILAGPEQGPPDFSVGGIREFNLPPGEHIFHIERWQNLGGYGGWQKIRQVEIIKVSVAQFRPGGWRYWADSHYGWWIVVYPDYTSVYSGYVN